MILRYLRRLFPPSVRRYYHLALTVLGDLVFGRPSKKLIVIGVTGTNGKTTTSLLISEILQKSGHPTAVMTTAEFRINGKAEKNMYKQTMLGRFAGHRFLAKAVKAGCTHAVVETSSEGVAQYRHYRIRYDAAVLTNLTPEHLESHGGFDAYKAAKLSLFEYVRGLPPKTIGGDAVPRVFVVNGDDEHASAFLGEARRAEDAEVVAFGFDVERVGAKTILPLSGITVFKRGLSFRLNDTEFSLKLSGDFNAYNAAAAAAVCRAFGVSFEQSRSVLADTELFVGRMEFIDEGQEFAAIVDYAHEPTSYERALTAARRLTPKKKRLLVLIGSCGGGRDTSRRPVLGALAAKYADIVVVSNEDPYDEDPDQIMRDVLEGATNEGKVEGEDIFVVKDREAGVRFLLSKAEYHDTALFLGKGCEPWIMLADGKMQPWDEREVVREELRAMVEGR